jgi:methylene-tetrahydromethanopterin dehydrogenase
VPPAGIEGLNAQDNGAALTGTDAVGIGALAIGGIKYKVEANLFRKMIETEKPLYLDFRDAFQRAREIIG